MRRHPPAGDVMDSIIVRQLLVETRVGATEDERARPQPVTIDIEIATDLRRAGGSDDLADTVDYGAVTSGVAKLAEDSSCALLEHLAAKIAAHIAAIPHVDGVTVEVAKVSPPIDEDVGGVAIRIERSQR